MVGKGGLPPLLQSARIRKSGGKPPFPTTNMLPSLVSHKALELGSFHSQLQVEFISKSSSTQGTLVVGKGGLPDTFKARDSEERGKPPFPTTNWGYFTRAYNETDPTNPNQFVYLSKFAFLGCIASPIPLFTARPTSDASSAPASFS